MQNASQLPAEKPVRTNKDRLYNDILKFLHDQNLKWKENVISSGERFVNLLAQILWYIDGHHHLFDERSNTKLPQIFAQFQNYNKPELSKHRKRTLPNLCGTTTEQYANSLAACLQSSYWDNPSWKKFKPQVAQLAECLAGYATYLSKKKKTSLQNHCVAQPIRSLANNIHLYVIPSVKKASPVLATLSLAVEESNNFQYLVVNDFAPSDPIKKFQYIDALKKGLTVRCMLFNYTPGSNIGNQWYIWKVGSSSEDECELLATSQKTIEEIKKSLPVFHSRAMRKAMYLKYGRICPTIKPATLRYLYHDLTGDNSVSANLDEAEIDHRMHQLIDMEDSEIIVDLRHHNHKQSVSKYEQFWVECEKFLNEDIGTAVDERRHGEVTHLARAISLRDFRDQVKAQLPTEADIPSIEWIRLQFWPKTPKARASLQHTSRFKVKYMVQQRQFRRSHIDAHYAAAVFRYQREYAIMMKDYCYFLCLDDKHRVKVGEPNFPVASAERGRQVLVRESENLLVGDHDFTKFSIIPSVTLMVNIPEEISDSWYDGQVYVGVKDAAFEPSSPVRHMVEVNSTLTCNSALPILFLYTDGGPDHRLTYISVQVSLICLFLKLDLDYLCAARNAPYHSWRNPVERIMSILNMGLQSVGLARKLMEEDVEAEITKCNSIANIRKLANGKPEIIGQVADSLSPVKITLTKIIHRLQLKEKNFKTFSAATTEEIDNFWSALLVLDETLKWEDKITRKAVEHSSHEKLKSFISHCCRSARYSFDILKCGNTTCELCKPVRLPSDIFSKLIHLPFPVPSADGHYQPFIEAYNKPSSSEEHRPSASAKRPRKSVPIPTSVQHAKNTNLMVQCEECAMWRLVYAEKKLSVQLRKRLEKKLHFYTFSCGATFADLELEDDFPLVYVRDISCDDPIEKLYYSAGYEPICIYCAQEVTEDTDSASKSYPQCGNCKDKAPITKM